MDADARYPDSHFPLVPSVRLPHSLEPVRLWSELTACLFGVALAIPAQGETNRTPPRKAEVRPAEQWQDTPLSKRDFTRTAIRSTAGAAIRQPVTTFHLGKAILRQRGRALIEDSLPLPTFFRHANPPAPGTEAFEDRLDRLGLPTAVPGTLDYLVGGEAFFTEFRKQVEQARESIDVQVFIFDNDDVSVHCADLLRQRANDLPVRVLIDDLGSTFAHGRLPPSGLPPGFRQPDDIADYLTRDSDLQLRQTLNPWLVADHTKLLVFDRHTAIIGGMNLGRESRHEWQDMMVSIRGPIVTLLNDDFNRTWKKTGPRGDLALLDKRTVTEGLDGPGAPLRILRTDASEGRRDILEAMLQAIRGSVSRIWIETPYFAMDAVSQALREAAQRGVDVRVILPSRANHGIMDRANLVTARNLLRSGVKVYRYPGMTHLKAMICDGWATVGSANLDTLSLRINRELNLAFSDPDLIAKLETAVFTPDLAASSPLKLEDTGMLLAPLIESIADQL